MKFRENMSELRILVNDYYQNRISYADYRQQRSRLLGFIDEELNGVKAASSEKNDEVKIEGSMVDKALSFLTSR